MNAPGYICKRCGGPSPVGVGYTDYSRGARQASQSLTQCACGWSVDPAADDGPYTIDQAADALGMQPWELLAFDQTLSADRIITAQELDIIRDAWQIARQIEAERSGDQA